MFIIRKHLALPAMLLAAGATLAACASPAPRLNGAASYGLSAITVDAGAGEAEFAAALRSASLPANAAARSATAAVTVNYVRYNAGFLGIFFGGPDHAGISVTLKDADGVRLDAFDLTVATDSEGGAADDDLARKAADHIAARAAAAWPPVTAKPRAAPALAAAPVPAEPVPSSPVFEPAPATDPLCVIGADGKCIPL